METVLQVITHPSSMGRNSNCPHLTGEKAGTQGWVSCARSRGKWCEPEQSVPSTCPWHMGVAGFLSPRSSHPSTVLVRGPSQAL